MSHIVFCCKLKKECEGLVSPPFPGPLGAALYEQVSLEAWRMWLAHQTMLINEYRLNLMDKEAKSFLKEELKKYFFGEGSERPSGYTPKHHA